MAAATGLALTGCAGSGDAADQVDPVVPLARCRSANSSLNVVAHEDDDILFMDPATSMDVAAGRCLTTVYLTAGDDGQGASYWQGREDGAMAAYAKMARTGSVWTTTELRTSSGQVAVTRTLNGTDIRLIFLRLPTGSPGGRVTYHHECLGRLRAGTSDRDDARRLTRARPAAAAQAPARAAFNASRSGAPNTIRLPVAT